MCHEKVEILNSIGGVNKRPHFLLAPWHLKKMAPYGLGGIITYSQLGDGTITSRSMGQRSEYL